METSIFISKIFGSVYILMGLGLIISKKYYQEMFQEYLENKPIIYLSGILILVLGFFMIDVYSTFQGNWTDIFVIFSYLILIKGSLFLLIPTKLSYFSSFIDSWFLPYLVLIIGIVFCYFGFVVIS